VIVDKWVLSIWQMERCRGRLLLLLLYHHTEFAAANFISIM
jgi:hypothetical protein